MRKKIHFLFFCLLITPYLHSQQKTFNFRIRTITAGVTLKNLSDTQTVIQAIRFLKHAEKEFTKAGYEVQTLRIATSNLYTYLNNHSLTTALPFLKTFEGIALRHGIGHFSVGQVLPAGKYQDHMGDWATALVKSTRTINFNLSISSVKLGIHSNSIKAAAEIITSLSKLENGEANFRFTASANCPPNIPFFPAAFHEGVNSFAIGLESPNLLTEAFINTSAANTKQVLKATLEKNFKPVQQLAVQLAGVTKWKYDGIDLSPAPGLDASIGHAIETYTRQPFGSASTLGACALITDVIKDLDIKKCGYSGLMLPVIEDTVLARRAAEQLYTVHELLLFSSVSGTGLDVVPIPGDTPKEVIERILTDVAALSLKYTSKALSARLFPIPNKKAGEWVRFDNPYLTGTIVMKVE
ncbi:MAG TPA: DUF711 family protein [Chitinophagaceae bacterium]|nr:DUF711 family protein [Chitinophagaceae bacterium]